MKDWDNGIIKCEVSYPTLAWITRQVERRGRGKGQVRPALKSDNIAGFCCCCLLPSLVYSSVLVTLETAVGAYRAFCCCAAVGRGVLWCMEREIFGDARWEQQSKNPLQGLPFLAVLSCCRYSLARVGPWGKFSRGVDFHGFGRAI